MPSSVLFMMIRDEVIGQSASVFLYGLYVCSDITTECAVTCAGRINISFIR